MKRFLSLILLSMAVNGMQKQTQNDSEISYIKQCAKISNKLLEQQQKNLNTIFQYDAVQMQEEIKNIDKLLQQYRKNVCEKKQEALHAIKEHFEVDDAAWKNCMQETRKGKRYFKKAMRQSLLGIEVVHHDTISRDIVNIIKICLKENDIEPDSVSIVWSNVAHECNASIIVQTAGPQWEAIIDEDSSAMYIQQTLPVQIKLYPMFDELSSVAQQGACIHEAWHVIAQHAIINSSIMTFLSDYRDLSIDDIYKSELFQSFMCVQEEEADMLPALKSKHFALFIERFRSVCQCAWRGKGTLGLDHYKNVGTVLMLLNNSESLKTLLAVSRQ